MKETIKGVFHKWIWVKLVDCCKSKAFITDELDRSEVARVLCNNHVPKYMHQDFLREMEGFKLVKLKNKIKVKVSKGRASGVSWFD